MRYIMKEKFWSLGGKYTITDASGRPVYVVVGKAFSWGHKLSFQDMNGNELRYIEQKLMTLLPRYEIYNQGQLFAEVVQEWSWFNKKFTLDVPGPNDYQITGSFWDHEYVFERSGVQVAQVSSKIWELADTYALDIIDREDDVAILATCVVIDLVCNAEA